MSMYFPFVFVCFCLFLFVQSLLLVWIDNSFVFGSIAFKLLVLISFFISVFIGVIVSIVCIVFVKIQIWCVLGGTKTCLARKVFPPRQSRPSWIIRWLFVLFVTLTWLIEAIFYFLKDQFFLLHFYSMIYGTFMQCHVTIFPRNG